MYNGGNLIELHGALKYCVKELQAIPSMEGTEMCQNNFLNWRAP